MSERLQINLNRTFREMMETYNEYNELLTNHPPPWSLKIKIDMKALLHLLKQSHNFILQSLDKWEDTAKKIKDEEQKNTEYGLLDTWRDDESHRKMIKELSKTILKGDEFLEMDDDNISTTSGSTQATNKTMVTASVPPINLPKFNGDYLKWTPFWQRFENAVHNGPYAKIEKLISLLGYLEGRALEEVDGFTVAEENYDTIVNTLKNRFGNKTLIVLELQEKLRGLETAKPDPESFRSTVNLICNMCRQLENLGVDIENESTKLDIINKLPQREKQELKWWLISESEKATVSELIEKMKKMALKAELAPIRESKTSINFHSRNNRFHSNSTYSNLQPLNTRFDSNPVSPNHQQVNKTFDSNRKSSNFEPLNNRFASTTPIEKQSNDKMKCSLCDGNHWASNCTKYATPDEKLKQLRSKNYCTKCSRSNHETKNCLSKIACRICNGNHFDYLCKDVRGSNKSSAFISVEKRQGILMTKDITVINPITKETADTVVIFDSGSQQSYVSDRIIQQLKLEKVSKEKINVVGFGAKASSYMASLVKLQIKTEECHKEIFANSTKSIATTVPVLYAKCSDSNDIKTVYKTPEILIGMDYFFEFINSFEKAENGNYIVNSCVGKMICKYIPKYEKPTVTSLAVAPSPKLTEPDNELKKFWNLEDLGIKDTKENEDESIILEKFKQNVKFENNRYYVSWPEKENHAKLPTNAGLALGRLNSTFKRLSNDPKLLKDCDNIINEQKERGTIEVAPEKPDGKLIHYLSSHAVITPQKTTTKVRMVFDASAKISKDSPSLNDFLIRGPLNMPDLGGILLRIRRGKYMLVGDIEKAFHQIYLNKTARDAVRFFWAKDPTKPLTKENLIVYRFIGVPFGVISSPFILWIIILLHLQKLDDEKLRNITENFYVDNIFLITDEKDKGIEQYKTIREHFLKASMNIREWLSNDSKINEVFPEEIRQKENVTNILGLKWNSETDTIKIELKQLAASAIWTKRKVLKFIASTFDPLGFLSPVTVKGRCFMQKLFKEKLSWDEPLNGKLTDQWQRILKDWDGYVEVPRKYFEETFPDENEVEIHAFADASKFAYCTCVYLRIKTKNGYETILIFAKTRLQPLNKNLTIPKLEIMGIWLAAKIIMYIIKQMKLENCKRFIWTDSQISYYWFQKHPKNVFVSNRLKEVLKSNASCYFVPGHLNPADLGTRGISFEELKNAIQWWKGPHFLKLDSKDWPKLPQFANDLTPTITLLILDEETTVLQNVELKREIEIDTKIKYSSFKQIVAEQLQQKLPQDINAVDLKLAEKRLIQQEQNLLIKPKDMKEFKLCKNEDGLFCVNCRFDHAELINSKPIFLPKTSPLTKLIIQDIHEKLHHSGIPHTLSKIREKFWIPSGRNTVKETLGKCKSCKYWKGKSFALPQMPNLPSNRVNITKPFQNIGIDYCGPFKVKGNKEKVWISLFTCFTTRLIHLEPVTSLNSEDFLFAFRRFVSRRGVPCYILSDNAKQFKTTATTLDELWNATIKDEKTVKYCNENLIVWDYITERAPWKGGLYERMVGLVKNALKQTIGRRFINFVEFWTFLCEVEATINSRPLTYIHATEPFVIRPIDFISPGIQMELPTVSVDNESDDPTFLPAGTGGGERLLEQYKKTTIYLDKFWNLWNKDYLNFLRERNGNEHKNNRSSIKRQPKVNETVLVYENDTPRGLWKKAKIKELIYSKDNEIRSVKIEYEDGFCTRRAVNQLYPIEEGNVDLESTSDQEKPNQMVNLHIQINKNENKLSSLQHSSHSFHSLQSSSTPSFSSCKNYQKIIMASQSLSLEDISSGELSDSGSEKEKLQKEKQETRKAESILRKELMVIKRLIENMMEDHNKIILDAFKITGNLNYHYELSDKLNQLNTKITEAFKTRNELLVELDEVKKENRNIREALNKYVR